jgi:hypothetical protein
MEGCLYKKINEKYYLINSIATYTMLAVEFGTFKNCFISLENFDDFFDLIEYNHTNVKLFLDEYEEFTDYINYSSLKDFNLIIYNNKNYYIRSWLDVFNFAAGRI